MKKSEASQGQSASELISNRITDLGDWRGETLKRMRKLIKEADPDVVGIAIFRDLTPIWTSIVTGGVWRFPDPPRAN